MNCKLGGAPWYVDIPLDGLMVIGFDVCHDTTIKTTDFFFKKKKKKKTNLRCNYNFFFFFSINLKILNCQNFASIVLIHSVPDFDEFSVQAAWNV